MLSRFVIAILSGVVCSILSLLAMPRALAVTNGQSVSLNDWREKSTVLIIAEQGDVRGYVTRFGVCTGTIISSDLILTAAHCLINGDNKILNIGVKKDGIAVKFFSNSFSAQRDLIDHTKNFFTPETVRFVRHGQFVIHPNFTGVQSLRSCAKRVPSIHAQDHGLALLVSCRFTRRMRAKKSSRS